MDVQVAFFVCSSSLGWCELVWRRRTHDIGSFSLLASTMSELYSNINNTDTRTNIVYKNRFKKLLQIDIVYTVSNIKFNNILLRIVF